MLGLFRSCASTALYIQFRLNMQTTKQKQGFTLIEIVVVMTILSILGTLSLDAFYGMQRKIKYESFIYKINHFAIEARNKSHVIEGVWDPVDQEYDLPQGYGVHFSKSGTTYTINLFQDQDSDYYYDPGEELKSYSEDKEVSSESSFYGVESNTETEETVAFTEVSMFFKPEPNPETIITTGTGENLYSLELLFYHLNNEQRTLRKIFTLDTISEVSEVNDYPIITDMVISDTDELKLFSNADIKQVSDFRNNFVIYNLDSDTDISAALLSAVIESDKQTITLSFSVDLPSSQIRLVYNTGANLVTDNSEELQIKTQVLVADNT